MSGADALTIVRQHRVGVLVTLRADGRPHTSNVAYAVIDGQVLISVTASRAKTRNLRRDPRAALHVSTPDLSAWACLECTAGLSAVSTSPGDQVGQDLASLYRAIAAQDHPDWPEYYQAMVDEQRLLLTLTVLHGYSGGAA